MTYFKFLLFSLSVLLCSLSAVAQEPIQVQILQAGENFKELTYRDFTKLPGVNETTHGNGPRRWMWQFPMEFIKDETLGAKHSPSTRVHTISRTKTDLLFDVYYTFDEYSRRVTPGYKKETVSKFLVLFGCSFTYGNGVNDDETINHFIAQKSKNYHPYNYAIGASAMNVMLSQVLNTPFKSQIPEENGVFVYIPIDGHVNRALGYWPSLAWNWRAPYFESDGNTGLVQKGSFETGRPNKTWMIKTLAGILPNSWLANRDLPRLDADDFEHACKMISESKRNLMNMYPKSRFIVYFHPTVGYENIGLQSCLARKDVEVKLGAYPLSASEGNEKYKIPFDGHPNALGNQEVAKQILEMVGDI